MQNLMLIGIAVFLSGITCQLALVSTSHAAEARSPGQGNPLDSLPKLEPAPAQAVTVDIQTQAQDPALQRLLASTIIPARFQISGVEALPFELIAAQFSPLSNREVSVADLLQAANKVTQLYQERGYPLSFAFVPDQTFQDNIVVVHVVEGYVGTVKIEGNPGASEERLKGIAAELIHDRPLSRATFERITGILGLQPGMKIKATVTPPVNTDGAAEMILDVKRSPVSASLGIDTATSSVRGILSVSTSGLTPLGEQISVSALAPRGPSHEKYYGVDYVQPIRKDGMLFQLSLSDYSGEPVNQNLQTQQFESRYATETRRISASVSYPLILKNSNNLTLTGGAYTVKNSSRYTRSVAATVPVIELSSDIRAVNLELHSTTLEEQKSTQWMLGIYQGLDIAGARQLNSGIDLDFMRIKAHVVQNNQFGNGYGMTVSANAQYSDNLLPLSEQISYGAKLFGLAYPAGEVAGDKGWGFSLELNRAFALDGNYIKQVQPYVLADAARVYSNAGTLVHNRLASFGLGMRFTDQQYYSLDLSVAQPIGDIPVNANSRSPRLNLSYSYQLE